MNDVDQLLSELNPMNQSPPPEVRSSEAEAIYEAAMAKFTTQSPLLPWYKALVGRPADTAAAQHGANGLRLQASESPGPPFRGAKSVSCLLQRSSWPCSSPLCRM